MSYYTLNGYLAQAIYGDGAYGSEGYQVDTTTSTGSSLTDTGMPIIISGTVGVSLIVCAVILFTKSRKRKKQ